MGYRHTRANGVPIRALFVDIINENNSLGNPVSVLYKMFRNTSQQWAANPVLSNSTYFIVQNYHSLYLTYRVFHDFRA